MIPLIIAAAVALFLLRGICQAIRRPIDKHGIHPLMWRFVSGHHMDGPRACCAKHCTAAVRWQRARRRLAPFTVTAGAGAAFALHLGPAAAAASALAGVLVLYPGRVMRITGVLAGPAASIAAKHARIPLDSKAARAVQARIPLAGRVITRMQHRREVVRPMAAALAPILEMPVRDARRALTIPANWQKPGTQLGVRVLPGWSATLDRQQFIEREVSQRLPGVDWEARYRLGDRQRRISFTPLPEPPRLVPLAAALGAIETTQQGKPVVGIDTRENPVYIDLDKETPHVGASIGTGGGKSDWLKLIIMQLLAKGVERVVIIDPKGGSQKWAEDERGRVIVPGIEIYYDLEDQWQAIEDFRGRMDTAYRTWRSDRRQQFTREVLILEEQNDFALESIGYWKRNKGRKDPSMPPPFDHIGRVLFKGRQANRNIISVYQRMSVQATGGLGDIRDQYGTKVMGRFSPSAWDSLAGTRPRGKTSTIRGRMIAITGADHQVMQAPWATDAEALDYVFSHGLSRVAHPVSLPAHTPVGAGQDTRERQSDSDTDATAARPVLTLVTSRRTLVEHADRQTVPLSYKALSKRRQRDPDFPEGVNKTYTDAEILAWYEKSAGQIRKEA